MLNLTNGYSNFLERPGFVELKPKKGSYKFPVSLYHYETVEILKLSHWILVDVPFPVCLKSIRTLHLDKVRYEDAESFANLISGCPNLENLMMHPHSDAPIVTFTIAVPSLQRLSICNGRYVINSPSLKYLKVKGLYGVRLDLIENMTKLVEAEITASKIENENLLGFLTSAQRLSLELSPLKIKFPTSSIFYQLVYLELYTSKEEWWNLLTLMLDSSPKLQVLKFINEQCWRGYIFED